MQPVIMRASKPEHDGLERTDWFGPDMQPTIEGEYEVRTGGGHVFRRRWSPKGWINSVTGLVSTAPLDWRGVKPGSVELSRYSPAQRELIHSIKSYLKPSLSEQHDAIGLPFA